MPLQHIQEQKIYVTYSDGEEVVLSDNLYNRVTSLKNKSVKDIKLSSGEFIKKDWEVIRAF